MVIMIKSMKHSDRCHLNWHASKPPKEIVGEGGKGFQETDRGGPGRYALGPYGVTEERVNNQQD